MQKQKFLEYWSVGEEEAGEGKGPCVYNAVVPLDVVTEHQTCLIF